MGLQTSETVPWTLVIIQVALSPILGAVAGLWVKNRSERERIKAHIEWGTGRSYDGAPEERPYVVIQNLSLRKVHVVQVDLKWGFLSLWRDDYSALLWIDPDDVQFPYSIEPGEIRFLALDEDQLVRRANAVGPYSLLMGKLLKRPRIRLEVRTLVGGKARVGAERALPYRQRPEWFLRPWWMPLLRKFEPTSGEVGGDNLL